MLAQKHTIKTYWSSIKRKIYKYSRVKICNDADFEDPTCSNANLLDTSVLDHATYMGYDMALELLTC